MANDGYANGRGPTTAWMAKVLEGEMVDNWNGNDLMVHFLHCLLIFLLNLTCKLVTCVIVVV